VRVFRSWTVRGVCTHIGSVHFLHSGPLRILLPVLISWLPPLGIAVLTTSSSRHQYNPFPTPGPCRVPIFQFKQPPSRFPLGLEKCAPPSSATLSLNNILLGASFIRGAEVPFRFIPFTLVPSSPPDVRRGLPLCRSTCTPIRWYIPSDP